MAFQLGSLADGLRSLAKSHQSFDGAHFLLKNCELTQVLGESAEHEFGSFIAVEPELVVAVEDGIADHVALVFGSGNHVVLSGHDELSASR